MKSFTHRGVFWLPDEVVVKEVGSLSFSTEDGLQLELLGSFSDSFTQLSTYPVIYGVIQGGKDVTLLDGFATGMSLGGIMNETIRSNFLVVGAHTKALDRQVFRQISVQVELLPEWSGLKPLHQELAFVRGQLNKLSVSYTFPDEVKQRAEDVTFLLSSGFSTKGDGRREFSISTSTWLTVRPRRHQLLEHLIGLATGSQQLISLCTDHVCRLNACSGELRVTKPDGRGWKYRAVELFFQSRFSEAPDIKPPLQHEFPVRFADLGDAYGLSLQKWFDARNELDSVFGLFFSARFGPSMLLDQHFMYYVQALETYHRWRIGGSADPPTKHERRIESLLAGTPKEYRSWLKQKLTYSNEPSLRHRLKGITAILPEVADDLIERRQKFIQLVLDTRNYFTHHDRRLKKRAARGARLLKAAEVVRYLVGALLFKELGFSAAEISQHLRRSRRYQHAIDQRDLL